MTGFSSRSLPSQARGSSLPRRARDGLFSQVTASIRNNPLLDAGHSLERYQKCKACGKDSCDLWDEAYERDPAVAFVPSHHGDTPTGRHAADADLIAHVPVDLRTLINEVKDAHKALDEANDTMFADLGRIGALEAEVKELRETLKYAQAGNYVKLVTRISQMEEALREVRKWCPECGGREYINIDPGPPTQQTRQFCPVCRFIRAALSPSDTEEKA